MSVNTELCLKVNIVILMIFSNNLHFKVFLTIYLHQFGWLSERERNFLNLLEKEGGGTQEVGVPSKKGGSNHGRNYEIF